MPLALPSVSKRQVLPESLFMMTLRNRQSSGLGWLLATHKSVQGLIVVHLGESKAIRNWNHENPESALKEGHMIVEVNGLSDAQEMLEEVSTAREVNLLVSRTATQRQRAIFKHLRRKHEQTAQVGGFSMGMGSVPFVRGAWELKSQKLPACQRYKLKGTREDESEDHSLSGYLKQLR